MAKKVKKAGKARKAAAKKKAAPKKTKKAALKKAAPKKARKATPKEAKRTAPKAKGARPVSRLAAAAATEEVVVVARDVPESMVDVTIEGFNNAGATRVTKTRQPDGKYTITAYFAD